MANKTQIYGFSLAIGSIFRCVLLVLVVLLTSCMMFRSPYQYSGYPQPLKPQYETKKYYTPPPNEQGKLCLSNCQMVQNQCEQMNYMQKTQDRVPRTLG